MREQQAARESLPGARRLALAWTAAALAALSPFVAARAQEAAKGEGVVRERRATKEEPARKAEAAKAEEAATVEGDAGLEQLRARVASEQNAAERARLQRALVERLEGAGMKGEAVALLREMLAEERFDPPFFFNTGNALARLGESSAAVEAYRKAVTQRRGNYARAQHNLGVVLARLGRWQEAEEALTAALRLENYTYAEASYNLGRLHALRGEAGLAIAEWTRTLQLKPEHADAAVALARTLAEDGDPEQALSLLDSFAARYSRRGAQVPRAVEVARGEITAAANVAASARAVEKSEAGRPAGHVPAAGTGRSKGAAVPAPLSDSEALSLIREARPVPLRRLTADRHTYELLQRARAARARSSYDEAAKLYLLVMEGRGGYFPPANLELGYTLAALGRHEEAIASILAVVKQDATRYPVAFYHLGRFYEHTGRFEHAGESFARASQLLGEESPQFFIDTSRLREKEGKLTEALAAAESYVRAMGRQGGAPDWAHERVARLREKAAAAVRD